jgi:prepilin-type N-terminal cleavage/methylation domain-containing protein
MGTFSSLSNNTRKGFTLIELLVVIAIIGLLSSVVFASLNSARAKARDAKRQADLQQVRIALELYYDANGAYPIGGWWYSCDSSWNNLQSALTAYMPSLPKDPINTSCAGPWNNGYYTYVYGSGSGQKYDLVGQFENTSHPERCAVRGWRYHDWGGETYWCSYAGGGYGYSPYMFADH